MTLRGFAASAAAAAVVVVVCSFLLNPAVAQTDVDVTAVADASPAQPGAVTSSVHLPRDVSTEKHVPVATDHVPPATDPDHRDPATNPPVHHDTEQPGHHDTTDHDPQNGGSHTGNDTGGHGDDEHKCPPEGEEGVRYAVAKFDFDHVRFPMIVAVWILFVTYAKIGNVRRHAVCLRRTKVVRFTEYAFPCECENIIIFKTFK